MKFAILLSLSLGFYIPLAEAFDPTKIPAEEQVILKKASSSTVDWTPSLAEVKQALVLTKKYLLKPGGEPKYAKREAPMILGNDGYRVQAWGIHLNGTKVLHLNFFPEASPSDEDWFKNWKSKEIWVSDGWLAFWNIDIDLTSGTIVHFETNFGA